MNDKLHRLVIDVEKLVGALEEQSKSTDTRQLTKLVKDLRFIIDLHEQKLMDKIEEIGASPDRKSLNYLSSALQRIDNDIRELKHSPRQLPKQVETIRQKIEDLDENDRGNSLDITDEDFIAVISDYKKKIQLGKIKPVPQWAKDERKEALQRLDMIIQKATDFMVAKALASGKKSFTDLTRAVEAPQSILRKSLASLEKQNRILMQQQGKTTVYMLKQ